MALMLNAMDDGLAPGTLTVRSRLNPDRADEILLEFVDTGRDQARKPAQDLEPFFTTKPQGRGTRLVSPSVTASSPGIAGGSTSKSQVGVGSNFKVTSHG